MNYNYYMHFLNFRFEDFHFSPSIDSFPGAYVFPKGSKIRNDFKQALQWIKDLGIYDFYKRSLQNRIFEGYGNDIVTKSNQDVECTGFVKERRASGTKLKQIQNLNEETEFINFEHFKIVCVMYFLGNGIALACFIFELCFFKRNGIKRVK